MFMIKLIDKILFDIIGVILIVYFIKFSYLKRYSKCANNYIKNQLNLLLTSSIVCILTLNIYYNIENNLKLDSLYLNGIGLAVFLGAGGILINNLYNKYFKEKKSIYNPTNEEYLFIIIVSFIGVTVKMFFDNIIGIAIPVALLLGKFLWLDTKDLRSLKDEIKVNHHRIIETSILFILGMLLISICMWFFEEKYYFIVIVSFVYGLIIYFPYSFIMSRLNK